MPAIPELTEALSDGRVVLRDGDERDIPEILIAYQDDPQLHLRLGEERPPSGAELGRRAEGSARERSAGISATLTILEPASDVCRGQLHVQQVDWEHERAELAIWVAPQVRNRGFASGALRLAASWLLRSCGLRRVQVLTEPDNEPMLRAARAAGFVEEGVLRAYLREQGSRVDNAVLSLLPSDLEP